MQVWDKAFATLFVEREQWVIWEEWAEEQSARIFAAKGSSIEKKDGLLIAR